MRLEAHKGAVKTLAYDPSKSTLYSGGEDGLVRRWVAASNSTEPQLPNRFVAPDPNSAIEEAIAAPSASVLQNRELVQWLKSLNINYTLASFGMRLGSSQDDKVDAMSVHTISSLKNLKTLVLTSSKISDDSLPAIQALKMLEQLDLSDTKISGENLSQLESLTLLKKLRIKGLPARDDWIRELVAGKLIVWENLKFLDVRDTAITSNGLKAFIGRRKGVDTYVSPQLFGESPEIEALLQLGPLRGTIQVDRKPLDVLKAIEALKSGGSITGLTWPIDKERSVEDLEVLAKLPKLERIEVSDGAIPMIDFPILVRVKGLIELELGPNVFIHDQVWPVGDIQQLYRLKLHYLYGNDQLAQLQKLKKLESLEYTGGVGIDVLAKALPHLKSLACSKQLTEAIPFLQSLEILTIPNSSDKDFGPNLAKLKNLKRLNVLGFPAYVSRQDLQKLQAALPGVTVESVKK